MKIEANKVPQQVAQPRTLSYSETNALKQEEQKLQDIKDGIELKQGVNYEADDLRDVEKRLAQIRKIRQDGEAPDLSEREKLHLEQKEKMIREHFHKINPSFETFQYLRPKDGPRYSRLVQQTEKNMNDPEYQKMVREWQDIQRKLHPDDAYAADTRQLYREA